MLNKIGSFVIVLVLVGLASCGSQDHLPNGKWKFMQSGDYNYVIESKLGIFEYSSIWGRNWEGKTVKLRAEYILKNGEIVVTSGLAAGPTGFFYDRKSDTITKGSDVYQRIE